MLGQVQSGGPINQNVQNIQNQMLSDNIGRAYNDQLGNMRASMGYRGLGGSPLQMEYERQLFDDAMRNRVTGSNQIALGAANTNWGAMQQAAGGLGQLSLGAGGFGLASDAQRFQQQQSLFQQLLAAIGASEPLPVAS